MTTVQGVNTYIVVAARYESEPYKSIVLELQSTGEMDSTDIHTLLGQHVTIEGDADGVTVRRAPT